MPQLDSAASSARASLDATAKLAESTQQVAFSGWLRDGRGNPLAGHSLRLSRVGAARVGAELETTAESGRDGRFAFIGVRAGSKLLEVRGPGSGDLPEIERDLQSQMRTRITHRAAEGQLYLTVPPTGLPDVTVLGPRHASFWIEGTVECEPPPDASADPALRYRGGSHLHVFLQNPSAPIPPSGPHIWSIPEQPLPPDLAEPILGLNSPEMHRDWERGFLVGADDPEDTLLVVRSDGFQEATVAVEGVATYEHIGTIELSRVAHFRIKAVISGTDVEIEVGSIEVKESGGGVPDWTIQYDLSAGYLHHNCNRRDGRYELRVTSPGYAEAKVDGDLVLSEACQRVEVGLVPLD